MADGAEQGVDDVSIGGLECVSFEVAVLLHVGDDRLDGVSSSQFAPDGGRGDATRVGDMDLQSLAIDPMAAIDTGAGGLLSGDAGDLVELSDERLAVIGIAGQRHGAEHELAALAALVGDRERGLHPELVSGGGLALADALDLRGMEGIELLGVAGLLAIDRPGPLQDTPERPHAHRVAGDLALDTAYQPAQPRAHEAQMRLGLLVTAAMHEACCLLPGPACQRADRTGAAARHGRLRPGSATRSHAA